MEKTKANAKSCLQPASKVEVVHADKALVQDDGAIDLTKLGFL